MSFRNVHTLNLFSAANVVFFSNTKYIFFTFLKQDSCIPPADRCRYRTDKEPTGPFNRKKLLDFLAKKAREDKDWEEIKPYVKELRGNLVYY